MSVKEPKSGLVGMGELILGGEFKPGCHRLQIVYTELLDCATAEERHRYLQTFIPILADLDLIDKVLTENGDVILGLEKTLELRGWLEEYKVYLKDHIEQCGIEINNTIMANRRQFLKALLPVTNK